MEPELLTRLLAAVPEYGLLILAGLAGRWWLLQQRDEREKREAQQREERERRDGEWRGFLADQRREFNDATSRIVADFIAKQEQFLGELRKVTEAVREHDRHASEMTRSVLERLPPRPNHRPARKKLPE